MGIPPPPRMGACARCLWHLQPRPWRPFARLRPLVGAADVAGSAAAGRGGADLLDRPPLADQCRKLARQHLPMAGSASPRPAWGDASALRLGVRLLESGVLLAAAKVQASGRRFQAGGLAALISPGAIGPVARSRCVGFARKLVRRRARKPMDSSAIPAIDQRFGPPAQGGIVMPDTGPSQASRAWRALRCR